MTDREYLTFIIEAADDLKKDIQTLEEETETLKRCVFEELSDEVTETTRERIRRCFERIEKESNAGLLVLMSWNEERKK